MMDLSSEESKKIRFYGIDIFKFICAILVLIIHCSPLKNFNDSINSLLTEFLCRIAVPFYFICNGYFLFRKNKKGVLDGYSVKKYIINLFKLYCIWTIIYFPQLLYIYKNKYESIGILMLLELLKELLWGYHFLWYFISVIWGVLIVYYLNRKIKLNHILLISFGLYIIAALGTTYYYGIIKIFKNCSYIKNIFSILTSIFGEINNTFFFSTIYICLGAILANKRLEISSLKNNLLLFFSGFIYLCEYICVKKYSLGTNYDIYFSLIPFVIGIFYKLMKLEYKRNVSCFGEKVKNYGVYIFYTHKWFIFLIGALLGKFINCDLYNLILFIVVLLIEILTVLFIDWSSNRYSKVNKFFKIIFT